MFQAQNGSLLYVKMTGGEQEALELRSEFALQASQTLAVSLDQWWVEGTIVFTLVFAKFVFAIVLATTECMRVWGRAELQNRVHKDVPSRVQYCTPNCSKLCMPMGHRDSSDASKLDARHKL